MGFEVGRIDHQLTIFSCCFRQLSKSIVEDTPLTPAQKTIIQRFMRTILTRRIFPVQAMPDDINDSPDDFQVIDSRNTT